MNKALFAASDAILPPNARTTRRTNIISDVDIGGSGAAGPTAFHAINVPRSRTLDIQYVFEDEEERALASIGQGTNDTAAVSASLLGGVLLQLAPPPSGISSSTDSSSSSSSCDDSTPNATDDWAFVSISVGDCSAYHVYKEGDSWEIFDITSESRSKIESLDDTGGKLGLFISLSLSLSLSLCLSLSLSVSLSLSLSLSLCVCVPKTNHHFAHRSNYRRKSTRYSKLDNIDSSLQTNRSVHLHNSWNSR
jgi:hypothetical protein